MGQDNLCIHVTGSVKYLAKGLIDAIQEERLEVGSTGVLDQHCGNAGLLVPAHKAGVAGNLPQMPLDVDIAVARDQDTVAVRHHI